MSNIKLFSFNPLESKIADAGPLPGTAFVETREHLHYFTALTYYSRIRFVVNLLPLIQSAPALRRVVTVFAGGKEGPIVTDDFPGWKLSASAGRGHFASMLTLSFEVLAKRVPEVSFVHDYPGFVKTDLARGTKGVVMAVVKGLFEVIGPFLNIPNGEVGERQTFFATSARFPPTYGDANDVLPAEQVGIAVGTDGKVGSGVYSVHLDGEVKVQKILCELRKNGSIDKL